MSTQKQKNYIRNISNIIWSEEAYENFKEIIKYLEKHWTEKEIKKLAHKLDNTIETIKVQPFLYPIVKKKNNIRKAVITKQITVYYEVFNNAIRLISIFDTRQNPDKLKI